VSDIHRREVVEFTIHPPFDQFAITEVVDQLKGELGDRWNFHHAVTVLVGEDREIVFRYLKAGT
jgi:hypothetical protein